MRGSALAALAGAIVISGAAASSASASTAHTPGDPWEPLNRVGYAVQGALDRVVIHPLASFFRVLTPGPIGHGVHNVIVNLSEPSVFIDDVLQLRFKRATVPVARFLTNTTIGLFGLFDVAGGAGVPHHDNEFGVTLGRYGVPHGPYMFVPLVGPTTVRDVIGGGIDALIDPLHWTRYVGRPEISAARAVVGGLDTRVMTDAELHALLSDAADPYATLRSVYLQNKQGEIDGGEPPIEDLPSFDDPGAAAPPPAAPATAGAVPVDDAPPAAAPFDPPSLPAEQTPG